MKNKIALILDVSGSMSPIRSKAIEVVNQTIKSLQDAAEKHKQRTELSLVLFDDYIYKVYSDKNIKTAPGFTTKDWKGGGMTALVDAVAESLNDFKKHQDYQDEDCSFVCLVVTDGGENASRKFGRQDLANLIKEVQKTDRFTITFQVPRGDGYYLTNLGISPANIREWETGTAAGMADVGRTMSQSIGNYYAARSSGKKSLQTFYTDLSNLNTQDLKSLKDLSKDYRLLTVDKEQQIRDFVEAKTGKPYQIGSGFYQLLKKEVIQKSKDILILDRKTNKVYGGVQARNLIGLPSGADAKVEPGLHGQYDIFVKSTSVNRKLPKASKVLVEK